MNIYKAGLQLKVRFESKLGNLTIEQLHDLPLTSNTKANLNDVAITIANHITTVMDFVGNTPNTNSLEELKLAIVKDIIADKKQEIVNRVNLIKRNETIEKLEGILEKKEPEKLEN